jgi:CRISPR/Cas system-associated endoribonuclease Cas2
VKQSALRHAIELRRNNAMKSYAWLFSLFFLLFLIGCSGIAVTHDYDQKEDFTRFKTFNWMVQPKTVAADFQAAQLQNSLFDKRLKEAVNAGLLAKGLQLVAENPDFLIVYHTGVKDKVNITDWGYGYGPYWGPWGGPIDVQQYTEGTLIIDFVDAQNNQLVWRGTATKALANRPSPEKAEQVIKQVVEKLLANYPPMN